MYHRFWINEIQIYEGSDLLFPLLTVLLSGDGMERKWLRSRTRVPLSLGGVGLVAHPSPQPFPSSFVPWWSTRVWFLGLWYGLGSGQKPLSSAPINSSIKFWAATPVFYSKRVPCGKLCALRNETLIQSGGAEGNSGTIFLCSWRTGTVVPRVGSWAQQPSSPRQLDSNAESCAPSQIY